jgi:hypothetical protein
MPRTTETQKNNKDYMHGAAIVDKNGKETPITEDMIQKALKSILKASQN